MATSPVIAGGIWSKWQGVEAAMAAETRTVAECRAAPERCASPAAARLLAIVRVAAARPGLARFGEINRAINLAIRPASDLTVHGVEDVWSSPLTTLAAGTGDCEDYAIAKMFALREAGVPAEDLRLIVIQEIATGEGHATLAARFEGHWRILDNRTMMMVEDDQLTKYQPLFAIDADGVKRFEQPSVAVANAPQPAKDATPAILDARVAVPAENLATASSAWPTNGAPIEDIALALLL